MLAQLLKMLKRGVIRYNQIIKYTPESVLEIEPVLLPVIMNRPLLEYSSLRIITRIIMSMDVKDLEVHLRAISRLKGTILMPNKYLLYVKLIIATELDRRLNIESMSYDVEWDTYKKLNELQCAKNKLAIYTDTDGHTHTYYLNKIGLFVRDRGDIMYKKYFKDEEGELNISVIQHTTLA